MNGIADRALAIDRQFGIALPTILILLFVITLMGVATLNTTVLEEKMSSNFRMRQVAFNAAESTLTFAENYAVSIKDNIRGGVLPLRDGGTTRLYVDNAGSGFPDGALQAVAHLGNTCTGGYCIPQEFNQGLPLGVVGIERWEDPAIDVWNDDDKHLLYTDFASTNLDIEGVFETPKFIIEYIGNYPNAGVPSSCGIAPLNWPFCQDDAAQFRITARAMAGFPGQEIVVILQSTINVP